VLNAREDVVGVLFGCSDPRMEMSNKTLCLGAKLLFMPMPGVDFGDPCGLFEYWSSHAEPGWATVFAPHTDCHWYQSNDDAVLQALYYVDCFRHYGVPTACVMLGNQSPEILSNHLAGHSTEERLKELFKKPGWKMAQDAQVTALHIGEGFQSLSWPRALRLTSSFVTDQIASRLRSVLDTFRDGRVLPVRFSEEVPLLEREQLKELLLDHKLPVTA